MPRALLEPTLVVLAVSLVLLVACGDDATGPGAGDDAGSGVCTADRDCDDGIFCNGVEVCDPGAAAANGFGCRPAPPPCAIDVCSERDNTCITVPCQDMDGDGHMDVACGGDDCDDADPDRFPGNAEVCDVSNVDEDCNPATFGRRDDDLDGFVDQRCCNGSTCGDDCDDAVDNVHRTAPEVCDGIDNDCDGEIDDGVIVDTWPDLDNDGFGDRDASPMALCPVPSDRSEVALDCDDGDPLQNPNVLEICDGVDQDCDDAVDEETNASCQNLLGSTTDGAACQDVAGTAQCRLLACAPMYDDCDGVAENGCEADLCNSANHCGACGSTCPGGCFGGSCGGPVFFLMGTVLSDPTGAPVEGATVARLAQCPSTMAMTDASGGFGIATDVTRWFVLDAAGHESLVASIGGETRVFSEAQVAAWFADADVTWDADPERGILVVRDLDGTLPALALDPGTADSSPLFHLAGADAVPGTGGPGLNVFTNVTPGAVTVLIEPGPGCIADCTPSDPLQKVPVRAGLITYIEVSGCMIACV